MKLRKKEEENDGMWSTSMFIGLISTIKPTQQSTPILWEAGKACGPSLKTERREKNVDGERHEVYT